MFSSASFRGRSLSATSTGATTTSTTPAGGPTPTRSLARGTEPVEFHREVKGLDAIILLETICTVDELEEQLDFIQKL